MEIIVGNHKIFKKWEKSAGIFYVIKMKQTEGKSIQDGYTLGEGHSSACLNAARLEVMEERKR